MKYITRIAPSPTGDMHLGTARTAYFNWLAARASGGQFILRIDDTDHGRDDTSFRSTILDTMGWLGLKHDVLIFQSTRFARYKEVAEDLIKADKAIELENGAIGLVTDMLPSEWHDELNGTIKLSETDIKNCSGLILIKGDGSPTYHFASVVDDIDFGVNFIIRGHDHLSNTPKHISLFNNLGADLPKFAHVGLIHMKKKKLSKRDNAASMLYYRDQGYDTDAMLNFMLRLGWGPTVDDKTTKMIDRDRALELFLDGGKMRPAPSNMDINMLESFDRKYKAKKGVWRNKDKLVTDGGNNDNTSIHKPGRTS